MAVCRADWDPTPTWACASEFWKLEAHLYEVQSFISLLAIVEHVSTDILAIIELRVSESTW